MNKRIIAAIAIVSMVGVSHAALFTSGFDGNTGAHIFAGDTDNVTGSDTVSITDWTTDASVISISGLTAIHPAEGGGFAQTQGGAGTYAGPNNIYLSRNHNLGTADHGYSLTFTIDTSWDLSNLNVLSGHSNNTGNQNQGFTSDLNFSLSGGTLVVAVTGLSTEDYGTAPAYHSVDFDLTGTTIGAGIYTLQVYQNNNGAGSYAIYDGITLDGDNGAQQPAITSFDASSTNVFAGETVTLSWETTNADTLSLDQGIGDVTGATQIDVDVAADTIYTLIAVNGNGSATSSVPVTVIATPPVIQSFAASSTNVFAGAEVTLSWQVDDATGLSIDQGLGDVTGTTSTQLVINADITYTLTATNVNGSVVESVEITLNQNPVLFSSAFDGNTGAEVVAGIADNAAGSATAGITDWTTDASVTAISGLTAISPGGGFVQLQGGTATFAGPNNICINHNLNIADKANPRGYSLTFTVDRSWGLGSLTVRAGHTSNTGNQNQGYLSDLTISLSGGTLGADVTQTILQQDYSGIAYIDSPFDLTGTTIGAGTYTVEVYENNLVAGGAYAVFDGILLAADAPKNAATLSISGPVSGGTEMEISWVGDSGSAYTVETNSNLIIGGWDTFMSGIAGTGGEITITNIIGQDQTFYRVITE